MWSEAVRLPGPTPRRQVEARRPRKVSPERIFSLSDTILAQVSCPRPHRSGAGGRLSGAAGHTGSQIPGNRALTAVGSAERFVCWSPLLTFLEHGAARSLWVASGRLGLWPSAVRLRYEPCES
jgi:hypothetical protein